MACNVGSLEASHQINRFLDFYKSISVTYHACEVHVTQTLSHYCKTCDALLCRDCIIRSELHRQHECDYIEKMVSEHRTTIEEALKQAQTASEKLTASLQKLKDTRGEITLQGEQLQEEIEKSFKEFEKILKDHKLRCLAMIKREVDSKEKLIAKQEAQLQEKLTEITKTIEGVKTTTNQGNEVLLKHKTNSINKLEQVSSTSEDLSLDPVKRADIGLHFEPEQFRKHLTDCCIKYSLADPTKCVLEEKQLQSLTEGELKIITISLIDAESQPCIRQQLVDGVLQSVYNGAVTNVSVVRQIGNEVTICFTPMTRGRNTLSIKVNNVHVSNSPLNVFVNKNLEELGPAVAIFRDLNPFGGIECSDDTLIVPENDKISIFDVKTKRLIKIIEQPAVSDVAIDPVSKAMFVSDRKEHRVYKFSADGIYTRGVGGIGKDLGQFNNPGGLAVNLSQDGELELYVCDIENRREQVFDLDLKMKRVFTLPAGKTVENITFSDRGNMYTTESDQIVITHPITRRVRKINRKPGKVSNGKGIKLFNDHLYVANCNARGSVSVFKMPQGEFVVSFGEGLLHYPQGLAVDKDGFVYVTSDSKVVYVF